MLALKFRDLKDFHLPFPTKTHGFPAVWQTCTQGMPFLVCKASPTFPRAGTELWTVFKAENDSISQTEENKIGWTKWAKNHSG